MLVEPAVPAINLPRVNAVEFAFYDHMVGAYLVTADAAMDTWIDEFCRSAPSTVAADIESRGLDVNKFSITCVTVAFKLGGDTISMLFDPLRRPHHARKLERVFEHASRIVFHGAAYDLAPLYAHRLITRGQIRKLGDTLVASRMVRTNSKGQRGLGELATTHKLMSDDRLTMEDVFSVRGLKKSEGWWATDIDTPTYAVGAMSDTVATLRLWGTPGVHGEGIMTVAARHLTAPALGFGGKGVLSAQDAERVVEEVQQVNQIVLERTARGYAIDPDFLQRVHDETDEATQSAARILTEAGIRPGVGRDLVAVLESQGKLPQPWPLTKGGQLSSAKEHLAIFTDEDAVLTSELAVAHRTVANNEKVVGYVQKVVENAGPTGRLHPEIKILGAHATGRMSAAMPEIQQFPKEARGVIIADPGHQLISADWKSIEPVVLATAAGDRGFIADMRAGKDPYEPVGQVAGVDRKLAKRKMLADMYGQGHAAAARQYGWTIERAKYVQQQIRRSLPIPYRLIDNLKQQSEATGHVTTLSGRVADQILRFKIDGREVIEVKDRVAPNHFCQGSALDIMHYSILECDRRGLSDHVHLWMHDEIIADKEVQEEVREVMSTPPPFLASVAEFHGMEAFLAVDVQDMGSRWEYV
ncbi:DNA polymerase I, thermostable (plasmid) [Tsukamurella tyrosinosolvens]|uniref:DNA-directed DNA polymerase n=1 Tax=Tsukamurella tyrosinosolvens TaxID=57704 RepID=A0A1H4UC40_TSUTY|nr:DNA polymerase [Tsukamurella tyrosinosolvens]KXO92969.1 hypothetical protein AXK58_13950 [Tsukamurella tyrosinosolvens]SEC66200.1 DNA polymerase I-3'-5' exonuclease and polymerase domains [Tsukamurella tyrosinosolvens]VEH94117.1 DNA polymerase I, thermostable [Tsukamurella tyrosinosolvens]